MNDSPLSSRDIIRYSLYPSEFVKKELGINIDKFPKQKEILNTYFSQDENGIDKYKYLVLLCGMRSGKSYLTSVMALYQLFRFMIIDDLSNWAVEVLQKEIKFPNLHWICAAKSEQQAMDTLFSKISIMLEENIENKGFFSNYNIKINNGEVIVKDKNFHVFCGPSHASGLVGRTVAFAAVDEFGHLKNTNKPPDGADYIFEFLTKSTMTLGRFGKMAVLSSPVSTTDPIVRKLNEAKTGKLPNSIWYHEPTWVMNPYEKEEVLRQECGNEATFLRDFAAKPGYVVYTGSKPKLFSDIKLSNNLINVLELDNYTDDKIRYIGLDPALKHDTFGIAIGYHDIETNKIIIDGIKGLVPKDNDLDARDVYSYITDLFDRFTIIGCGLDVDTMFVETCQMIKENVRFYSKKMLNKSHYDVFKEDMQLDNIEVVYNDKLYKELKEIEIINDRRVDHPSDGSKDISDAVVQCHRVIKESYAQVLPIKYFGIHSFR